MRTSSMPAPAVIGATLPCSAVSWSRSASTGGQMCSQTWLVSSRAPAPSVARARRIASRQLARARSMCGSAVTLPVSSRTTTSWRTWASATRRWSWGLPAATACSSSTSSGASSRVSSKSRSRHRLSRRPTIGCTSRTGRSSSIEPVRLRAEGEVADLALVVGHDAHGDPAHLGGERHPGERCRERRGGLLLVDREVGPVHVEVDDGLVARGAVGDQVGEQPGQRGAVGRPRRSSRRCSPGASRARRAGSRPSRRPGRRR